MDYSLSRLDEENQRHDPDDGYVEKSAQNLSFMIAVGEMTRCFSF